MSASVKRPKVLILVHEEGYGGGGRQSFYILEKLVDKGYPAVLVTNSATGWLGQAIRKSGYPVSCHFVPAIQRAINPFKELWVFLSLLWIFITEKPHVVVSAGVKLVGLGSVAAWLARVPRKVAIIRGQGGAPGKPTTRVILWMDWLVARLGTRFITVCDFDRDEMLRHQVCSPDKITTVHNGTEIARYAQARPKGLKGQYNLPKNAFVIGMVGRLSRQKRYDEFIEMMALLCKQHANVYGFLIGEGDTRQALQSQINVLGLANRVFITGFMESMPSVYADLDLSILFTRYEGCANALVESIASGLPCIADDVCGNAEIIQHGVNGYIVPPHQIALAADFAKSLIENPSLRKDMGQASQSIAAQKFNREQQILQLISLLSD